MRKMNAMIEKRVNQWSTENIRDSKASNKNEVIISFIDFDLKKGSSWEKGNANLKQILVSIDSSHHKKTNI